MELIVQIGVIFVVCLGGELVSALLPFAFPASVSSMVLLFLLLAAKIIKPRQISETSGFLLGNMAMFFVPSCVSILKYVDVLLDNFLPIALICIGTTPLVFFVTGQTVQLAIRLMEKKEGGKRA